MAIRAVQATLPKSALILLSVTLVVACSDSEPTPTGPPGEAVQVDAYLADLPPWAEFSAPLPDADEVASEPSLVEQQGEGFCTEREASITRNPQDLVMFSPDREIMWLGSLVQGRHHRDGLGSLLELPIRQRAPLTVTIDLLFSDNQRVVPRPDVASVGQAVGELIDRAELAQHGAGSSIFFSQTESHSFEQASLSVGLSTKYFGPTVRASFQGSRTDSTSTLLATFTQRMFTTSVVLPQTPAEFFSDELTPDLLQVQIDRGNLGPDNLPVFVSSIAWGRMLLVQMTSTHSLDSMKTALSVSAGKDSVGGQFEYAELMDESQFTVAAIGGHAQAAIDLIKSGELASYFDEDAPLTSARPLSYVLRNLGDNAIAKVSETTEYTIRECSDGGVKQFLDRDAWDDAVGDTLEVLELFTVRENLQRYADEVDYLPGSDTEMGYRLTFPHAATGFGFDVELLNRSAADIPDNSYKVEGLVYADNELPRHNDLDDGWISIGDVDGVGGNFVSQLENDDFVISISEGAVVHAIGFSVGDNQSRSGESITVEGGGFTFTFNDPSQIPGEGFVGFVAPFPIERVIFDEDAGGDDIAMRDMVFGVVRSGS